MFINFDQIMNKITIMNLGKFKKPPLRKVKMSTDQMLSALLGKQGGKQDLRAGLKKAKK